MSKKTKFLTHAAIIAALYAAITYLQAIIAPSLNSSAIQFRVSEMLCVLALFTPAAIPGLTLGCLLYNLSCSPLDILMGTAATLLAASAMYGVRKLTLFGYPLLGMLMPALFNGLLVGWMLAIITPMPFYLNALYVAIGEVAVLLICGSVLFYALKIRNLDKRIFQS